MTPDGDLCQSLGHLCDKYIYGVRPFMGCSNRPAVQRSNILAFTIVMRVPSSYCGYVSIFLSYRTFESPVRVAGTWYKRRLVALALAGSCPVNTWCNITGVTYYRGCGF